MSLLEAVDATLGALSLADEDAALAELTRLYARQVDQAAAVRSAADRALRDAEREGDEELIEQVRALRAKLSERDTLDRIGQRVHAALIELQATPKQRPARPAAPAGGGALGKLRAVR